VFFVANIVKVAVQRGALSQSTLVPTKIVLRNNFVALKLWGFIGYGDNGII
jgi:hypothetical protein